MRRSLSLLPNRLMSVCVLALTACDTGGETTITEIVTAPPIPFVELPLDSIAPTSEPLAVGFAGDRPADIGRYLLARGAQVIRLSPDGQSIAFRATDTGTPQLWIIPVVGGQARQMTFGNGVTFFEWTPDSSGVMFGSDKNGNEQESYFLIAKDGAREREVLPASEGGFRAFGGFSVEGEKFAYASTVRNGLDFDIYVGDSATGETTRVYDGTYGFYVSAISNDGGSLILSEAVGEDSDNLYILDLETGEAKALSQPTPRANHTDGGVVFGPKGNSLYFATNKDREFSALVKYNLENGESEVLFAPEADVENVSLCGKGGHSLVWTTNEDGFSSLHGLNLKTQKALKTPALPDGVYRLSCGTETDFVAIKIESWDTPGDIWTWNTSSREVKIGYRSTLAGLTAENFVKPISVKMPARDGVELQGLLYLPKTDPVTTDQIAEIDATDPESVEVETGTETDTETKTGEKGEVVEALSLPPVVFTVHGGPTAQSRPGFNGPVQYLVNQGIAVFAPNVRGSTGFGRTYMTLDDKKNRLDSVRDLVDMLNYLSEQKLVDGDRAAVRGGSYGGYAVNAVLAAYPETFKAGVSLFGVADWVTALEVASPGLKASDIIEYGDITDPDWRSFYEEHSPIRQADAIKVPVLFSHGEMDPRIDISETETMVRTLRNNNVQADFIRIPDEGHGWRKLSNQLFYYRYEAKFLEEMLAPPTPLETEPVAEAVELDRLEDGLKPMQPVEATDAVEVPTP